MTHRLRTASRNHALGRVVSRIVACLCAVAVVVGLLRGGARYFYCPMMHVVLDAPCCPGERQSGAHEHDPESELRSRDCCEEHVITELPPGAAGRVPVALEAPLLATLPAPILCRSVRSAVAPSTFEHEDRAGPRRAARHRAELMVSLS